MNRARVQEDRNYSYNYGYQTYTGNPIQQAPVITGYFHKESSYKEMAIRKVNATLCGILGVFVLVAFVSYYFEMCHEITLNTLSRQVTTLNDENAELQNQLDRLKSFNNVDYKITKYNLLQKAAKVIEVPAVQTDVSVEPKKRLSTFVNWAIGY